MVEKDIRSKFVELCKGYLGYNEKDGSYKKIIDLYNSMEKIPRGVKMDYGYAWCAAYVSAMAAKAGYLDIIPAECSCSCQIRLWKSMNRWVEDDNYAPSIGDFCYYDWEGRDGEDSAGEETVDHVGIVSAVSSLNDTITVIEGNHADSVKERYITIGSKYICGYGLPDFASKLDPKSKLNTSTLPSDSVSPPSNTESAPRYSVTVPQLREGSIGTSVKSLQSLLNGASPHLLVDGEFGPATLAAVKSFQSEKKIEVDGIVGPITWDRIING